MIGKLLLLVFCCFTCVLWAQVTPADQTAAEQKATPQPPLANNAGLAPGKTADYRLGPGDKLEVTLYGLDDPKHLIRVSNSGKIHLPYLRVFRVTGLTSIELEAEIARRLQEQKLVKQPQVKVHIAEFRAQPVYILGEVGKPGQYVLAENKSLMDLITMAGGINDVARSEAYLYRRTPNPAIPEKPGEQVTPPPDQSPHYEVIKVDLTSLIKGEQLEVNLPLQGGDLFYVPEREIGVFYVVGDVLKTGAFEIPQVGTPLFVTRALSMAGGPNNTAKMSKGMLVRYDSAGQRQELKVDFAAIFKGKQPDFAVQPNDVIFVPGSNMKTIGYGVLGALPSMAGRAIYSSGGGGSERSDQGNEE